MDTVYWLNHEEKKVAEQVERYFHSSRMSFREKLFHALLIAQHDLDAHHFCSESEREVLVHFISVLDGMLSKLHDHGQGA